MVSRNVLHIHHIEYKDMDSDGRSTELIYLSKSSNIKILPAPVSVILLIFRRYLNVINGCGGVACSLISDFASYFTNR